MANTAFPSLVFFGYNWRCILVFSTLTAHLLQKLKLSVLLVMKGR